MYNSARSINQQLLVLCTYTTPPKNFTLIRQQHLNIKNHILISIRTFENPINDYYAIRNAHPVKYPLEFNQKVNAKFMHEKKTELSPCTKCLAIF